MEPLTAPDPLDKDPVDVAVIGGGLAGLVAANEAARAGASVLLVERSTLGGRARSTTSEAGFTRNRGPHALYVGLDTSEGLTRFGVNIAGHAPALRGSKGLLNGQLQSLPVSASTLLRTRLVPARGKPGLARFLSQLPSIETVALGELSMRSFLCDRGLGVESRRLVEALIRLTTYSADPQLISADAAVSQLKRSLATGVWYLDGGWQSMIDELANAARDVGVSIRENTAVETVDGTRLQLAGGATIDARSVVFAGLTPEIVTSLAGGSAGGSAGGCDLRGMAGPAVAAAVLELGVRGIPRNGFVLGIDEPLYLSRHAPPADLAPAGHSAYGLMRYLSAEIQHDHTTTRTRLEALAGTAGIVADDVIEAHYSHRLIVANGLPLASRGGLVGRPAVDALGAGRFLAGDWVGQRGLLADASTASGLAAGRAAALFASAARSRPTALGDRR